MKAQTEQLIPLPSIVTDGWGGYQHFKDPTRQPFNVLNYPSINCFIPSKDKIVPRLGKTILGQRSAISDGEIGFGDFSYNDLKVGDIKLIGSTGITNARSISNNASVKLDDTHAISVFMDTNNHGAVGVVKSNPNGFIEYVGTGLVFETLNPNLLYSSIAVIDATHFIIFWEGIEKVMNYVLTPPAIVSYLRGYCQIFSMDENYNITAVGSPYIFDGTGGTTTDGGAQNNSCSLIDSTHIINFWQDFGGADNSQVLTFDVDSGVISVTSSLTVSAHGYLNSSVKIDANHFINFWVDSSTNVGYTQVFEVNLSTWVITAKSSPVSFDTGLDSLPSAAFIDGSHIVNCWSKGSNGYAQIFSINLSTFAVTAMSTPHLFESGGCNYNSVVSLGNGKSFLNFWRSVYTQKAQIFIADVSTGVITAQLTPKTYESSVTNFSNNAAVYLGNNIAINVTNGNLYNFSIVFNIDGMTYSVPCAGNNRILYLSILSSNTSNGDRITGVTYGGVAMTQVFKIALDSDNERYLYYLVNPAVNYNDLVISCDSISISLTIGASAYFNVVQTAPTILSSVGPTTGTSISISETPTIDKSWIVAFFSGASDYTGGLTKGSNTVFRGGNTNFQMADSGGPITPAALTTLLADFTSSTNALAFAAVMAPIGGNITKENWPIIGHKKRYTNDGGYSMEVRVTRTDDDSLRDIVEVLLPNPITQINEWYQVTEKANPLEQGITSRIFMDEFFDTNLNPAVSRRNSRLIWVNGTKTPGL